MTLLIEYRIEAVILQTLNNIIDDINNKENPVDLLNQIKCTIPIGYNCGRGGSHIWVTNREDKRIFLIILEE